MRPINGEETLLLSSAENGDIQGLIRFPFAARGSSVAAARLSSRRASHSPVDTACSRKWVCAELDSYFRTEIGVLGHSAQQTGGAAHADTDLSLLLFAKLKRTWRRLQCHPFPRPAERALSRGDPFPRLHSAHSVNTLTCAQITACAILVREGLLQFLCIQQGRAAALCVCRPPGATRSLGSRADSRRQTGCINAHSPSDHQERRDHGRNNAARARAGRRPLPAPARAPRAYRRR